LNITKGVVATDNPGPYREFVPDPPGPVSFDPPTPISGPSPGTCPHFTPTIDSDGLDLTPIDSDLIDAEVGDAVRFAIVVENTGTGPNGAFDVQISDDASSLLGYSLPAVGFQDINLCVTYGDGTAIPFTNVGGGTGLFDMGIELTDQGPVTGALEPVGSPDGRNLVVVTYELIVDVDASDLSIEPDLTLTNTASLSNFANEEGGANYLADPVTGEITPLTDPADVSIIVPEFMITKGVVSAESPPAPAPQSDFTFTPSETAPVPFTSPNNPSGPAGCPRFVGTINSTNLAATPIDSDLSNADVPDYVTFAIVLENKAEMLGGAFDVQFRDTIPVGFAPPSDVSYTGSPGGVNLCVTDGVGAPIA
jgi:hypothetical protein